MISERMSKRTSLSGFLEMCKCLRQFAPFQEVLASTRRKTFTRDQVERLLRAIHTRQQLQAVLLQRASRARREVTEIFHALERLNSLKNDGLYVGHSEGRVRLPNSVTVRDRARIDELGEVVVEAAAELVRVPLTGPVRRELADSARTVAAQVLLAKRASATPPLEASPRPSGTPSPGTAPRQAQR